MWHRIVDGQIVESVTEFGDQALREMSPGELRERLGWVRGREMPRPVVDEDIEALEMVPVYHRDSGVVEELWRVVEVDTNSPVYVDTDARRHRRDARDHPDVKALLAMTPVEVAQHIDNVFSTLTAAQRRTLRALAVAVRVLASRRKLL